MAIFKALTFDGVNSLDYGIYITGEAVYNAPERAVEMINIPGKNGALALDQGRFENIEVTYHAGCFADSQTDFADKVMKFRNALASRYTYKRLTDEYHPDEYRLGLYKSGLDVDAVRYGTAGEFNIVFDCKPQRFLVDGDREILPTEWTDLQTTSGELVTIDSDGSLAVKSLEVSLEPIQDLNGYSHPWVGGAGKNKLPYPYFNTSSENNGITRTVNSDGSVTFSGTATGNSYFNFAAENAPIEFSAGNYVVSVNGGESNPLRSGVSLTTNLHVGSTNLFSVQLNATTQSAAFTPSQDGILRCYVTISSGTTVNATIKPMIRLASETDATYEPYENICPISGRTKVVTRVAGKNLLPMTLASLKAVNTLATWSGNTYTRNGITFTVLTDANDNVMGIRANGTATAETTFYQIYNTKLPIASGQYVINGCPSGGSDTTYRMQLRNGQEWFGETGSGRTFTYDASTSGTDLVRISILQGVVCNNVVFKPMIRLASDTDDSYEPYNGNTYTTALGRTVYGGTIDVISGELIVNTAYRTFNGSENWETINQGLRLAGGFGGKAYSAKNVSNMLTYATSDPTRNPNSYQFTVGGFINVGVPYTVAEWKSLLATTNLQVVYELANPQTYQLTSRQISLLLGENHLWSDGEITVEYGVHPYYNPTPFDAKPLIKVTGNGTLGIGEYILTITGSATQTLYIDCETMEIYTIEGTVPTGASSLVSINKLDFPVLKPGTNYISVGSGITAVTITPRWWRI